jgi:Neuraminidase (sialidase)
MNPLPSYTRRGFLRAMPALAASPFCERLASASIRDSTYLSYYPIDLSKGGVQCGIDDLKPYPRMKLGGVAVTSDTLPKGLRHAADVGVVVPEWIEVRAIHRFPQPDPALGKVRHFDGSLVDPVVYVDCPRPLITPKGDYLLSIISGKGHYGFTDPHDKVNDILLYRSTDKGISWTGPKLAANIPYNQHAWVPLVPKSSSRIYVFGTEPAPNDFQGNENAGIAFRFSDDDGHNWSKPQRIDPHNDPNYQGMWCINMTETEDGAWLLAPHTGSYGSVHGKLSSTWLYVLRSEDQGRSWTALPRPRPSGWQWKPGHRMDEGRPLALGNGGVVLFARTEEGHIWQLRSHDDGKTWTDPSPTPLVHPDAPPMIEKLSDRKTIIALHHNRSAGGGFNRDDRSELWVSLSHDDGITWTEPRFFMSTSTTTTRHLFGSEQYCITYCDLLADDGTLNIFLPHLWRQVLQVRMKETELVKLPTKKDLFGALAMRFP